MKAKDLKEVLNRLADSDPDGFGDLREQVGDDEWGRIAAHAAGFINAWMQDRIEEQALPERILADALAAQLRATQPLNGYAKDVLARHARARNTTNVQVGSEHLPGCRIVTGLVNRPLCRLCRDKAAPSP